VIRKPPIYFGTPSTPQIRQAVAEHRIGVISTPDSDRESQYVAGAIWCADNGCFSGAAFSEQRWWDWLVANTWRADTCVFATAPDVVGDHAATIKRSLPWLPRIRTLGYPAAFVLQDGATLETIPWAEFDVLFIGGTTGFKLGETARAITNAATKRGLWVHMGRVNSAIRYRYAESIGCSSVDGTYLKYAPQVNLADVLHWIEQSHSQPPLFRFEDLA
jgi:hypothetical protein